MIKRTKYFFISIVALLSVSCNDWLELLPPGGLIREEFWKTKQDVEAVLMASYGSLAQMDRTFFIFGEIRADMLQGDINQPNSEELLMESNIFPDNGICRWASFYSIINKANEIIKNAPVVQEVDNTFTDFEMKGFMAEAYFIRSLVYFYLVRIYGDVPLVLEPTERDDSDIYLPKSSSDEILDLIVSDLEANRAFAPSGGFKTIAENKGRASKAAFDALLADIALWRFDYEAVITHVENIENSENYVLMPSGRWFEIFYPGNSLEGIFELQFDGNLDQNNSMFWLTFRFSETYDPSQSAIEMFSSDYGSTEIVRGPGTIVKEGEDDFNIWKYVGRSPDGISLRSGTETNSCNWIVYRYADVLLMKAEALSQLGRYQEAADYLSQIRARASISETSVLPNNPIAYEDAILNERAREFAYEGKRWFDLLRMGRRNNFARKSKLVEIIVSNVPSTQKRILSVKLANPLGWYLPIYEDEIERNQNLVQNPYYDF